ncbi:Insulinase (Peptidase M16), partial [Ascosphaera pollenicola]
MSNIKLIASSPSIALPLLDTRQYRIIRLPNNLEACLIHDPDTDKAAASMDVNVGNYSDPEEIPGLAHCLEHALFMGTKKYPKENEYREYLAANAGHSNAWTNQCNTNYHFEVAASSSVSPENAASDQEQDTPSPHPAIDRPNDDDSSSLLSPASFSLSETSSVTESNCGCHPDSLPSSPLYGALDCFAQFFIAPLFLESSLQRELHAVDSENKKNFQNDAWRLRQLSKTLSNPAHPYHKFICGNLETLRDSPAKQGLNIREEFMRFHEREYSAHRTKLVVLGREDLSTLQEWVVHLFADVPDKSLSSLPSLSSTPLTDTESYTPSHLSKLITVIPVMSRHELHIRFTYQDEDHLSATQPGRYLMHLIGHEGPGSILSALKSAGWANNLFAGPHPEGPGNAFFMVYIYLTEHGVRRYEDVVKVVFAYLSLLRRDGVQRRIWEEIRALAEVEFKWKAKSQHVMGYASMLANRMHKPLKREGLISGYDLLTDYDEESLRKAIELLKPEMCNLTLVSGAYVREKEKMGLRLQREKWYGTEYIVEDIPERLMQEMKSTYQGAAAGCTSLHLPNPNPFIPSDLVVNRDVQDMGQRQRRPDLLINNSQIRLWFKKDDTFFVPKATINLLIRSPLLDPAAATLANTVIAEVYCKLVTDALTEYSYDAALTGYTYSLQPLQRRGGIHISLSGYSDKIYTLLDKILTTFKELDVRETQFARVKEEVVQDYKNEGYTEPFRQADDVLAYLVSERAWTVQEKLAKVEHAVVLSDIHTFKMGFLSQPTHFE